MTVTYKNRYNDSIEFNEVEDGKVLMKGSKFLRFGFDEYPTEVNMVDPSGGPYIALGSNLKLFFEDEIDRFVSEIKILDGDAKHFGDNVDVLFTLKNN